MHSKPRALVLAMLFIPASGCGGDWGLSEEDAAGPVEPIGEEREGVLRVLARKTGRAVDEISSGQTLDQLGLDDFSLISVLSELEDRYGITIADESIEAASATTNQATPSAPRLSVGRLIELVKRARGAP